MSIPPPAPLPGGAEAAHAERLFALSQDLLGAADARGYLRWVNAAWERTTGWSPAELYAVPYAEFMHPEDRAHVLAFAQRLEHTPRGESLQVEARARCKDGSYRFFRCSAAVADGPEPLVYLSAMDVTDLYEARTRSLQRAAELERSNAELERFASVVSHDLRQSLTAVSGFLALLESRYGDQLPAGAAELLTHAREGGGRMHLLLDDLLAYARVGHSGRAFERVDCAELVRRIAPTAAAGATLEAGELPVVLARPREFEQLLTNLLANAVKFVAPGVAPAVWISAVPDGDHWRFEVADNGIGVARPHAQRIFGMFARSPAAEQYPGTGIGLAIAQKVVEAAGGRIWVRDRDGGGSVFAFTWPQLT
ncbi:MAG TPA: ATP-binding protein [Solirubrobacter sp.]|nr:ATP-binding protein [Solirubrobacter sp.]